jgi:outer membrane receptor protein involved in Fe transport
MFRQLSVAALAAIVLVAMPVASNAQDTTSAIRGRILDPNGAPVAGASIIVEDTRSGVTRSLTSSDDGLFLATRLLPGGPYRVTVNGTDSAVVPSIDVGDTYNFSMNLIAGETIDEIVTVGKATDIVDVASGPAATFSLADLENTVAFSRDIADVYGIDPRLMIDIDEDGVGINCGGKHPRFNSTTLDGVSVGDRFGLNENGYATAVGMPFPYDGIEQVAVELAPFDVTYGGFSACIINSVTRAGTNEWEGKAFYEYSNNDMRGDTIKNDDNDYGRGSYDKWNMGFNIGGPIIKDKLFFHASYEKSEVPRFLAKGYAGSGNGEERSWLSQADYERIDSIAQGFGYDTGGEPGDGLQENEKYLLRVDWNITDNHNAAAIYGYFDGYQLRDSDGDDNEFEFANHYYTKGAEFESMTFKVTSQWTDNFSTELFYNNSTMDDSQVTVGDKDFGDIQITVEESDGTRNTVYLGADDSRQANSLDTETDFIKLSANYLAGNHVITGGYERETLDIFNIFVQHSNGGEYDFFDSSRNNDPSCAALTPQERYDRVNGCGPSGIDRFELGRPSVMYYGSGGGTNNPLDAAAVFSNTQNTVYLQDEIFVDHLDLTLVAGLRYEWWESDDRPTFNQAFTDATGGLRNDGNLDGIDLLMPRLGFTWEVRDDLSLRGGVGKYSGGNPNVWISNAWSNDGVTNVQSGSWDEFRSNEFNGPWSVIPGSEFFTGLVGDDRPYYGTPTPIYDFVANTTVDDANDRRINLIDPDFKQPAEWKFALGGTWDMPWYDLSVDFDWLHTRGDNMAYYKDVSQEVVGLTTVGSPIYDYYGDGEDNLMLTNSGETPTSNMLSFVLSKEWEWGLEAKLGYAWVDGEDVSPMVASTASSNFTGGALLDINNPRAAQSNWTVPQRLTLSLYYSKALFGDNLTRIMLQGYANEGQAQSYVMESDGLEGDGFNDRHLLYVPTGPDDQNVVFDEDFEQDAFFAFVAREGLAPGFVKRNDINARWTTVWNLSIRQDISLGDRLRAIAYLKIRNLGNLLNDDWGRVTDAQYFPVRVVEADVNDNGQFVFESFADRSLERVYVNPSLWEARIGIDIRFGGGY